MAELLLGVNIDHIATLRNARGTAYPDPVQAAFIAVTISSYRLVYGRASGLLINNMCMLLMIGFIMITRLSFDKAIPRRAHPASDAGYPYESGDGSDRRDAGDRR